MYNDKKTVKSYSECDGADTSSDGRADRDDRQLGCKNGTGRQRRNDYNAAYGALNFLCSAGGRR